MFLGYKPYKITHSSDYFDQLYEYALQLILKDAAYVCHQTVEEIRGFNVDLSPYRNRPIEESYELFQVFFLNYLIFYKLILANEKRCF